MTDEELVKRLRERGTYNEVFSNAVWDSTADRIEQLAVTVEALTAGLKSLVEICEITRDTSGFYKKEHAHQVTPQQWSSWCKQIKTARAALKGESHE